MREVLHVVVSPLQDRGRCAARADVALKLATVRRQKPVLPCIGVRLKESTTLRNMRPPRAKPKDYIQLQHVQKAVCTLVIRMATNISVATRSQTSQQNSGAPSAADAQLRVYHISVLEIGCDVKHTSSPSAPPLKLVELKTSGASASNPGDADPACQENNRIAELLSPTCGQPPDAFSTTHGDMRAL